MIKATFFGGLLLMAAVLIPSFHVVKHGGPLGLPEAMLCGGFLLMGVTVMFPAAASKAFGFVIYWKRGPRE